MRPHPGTVFIVMDLAQVVVPLSLWTLLYRCLQDRWWLLVVHGSVVAAS